MRAAGLLLPNLGLPIPTKFLASPAKSIGVFGLVWRVITNAYHPADLGLTLPRETFTNHYHRTGGDGGPGDDLGRDQTDQMGRTVNRVGFAGLAVW